MKRTTELFIERDELLVVRRRGSRPPGRCEACGGAEVVTPEAGAVLAGVGTRALYRLVEAGLVHFRETPEGFLLVCLRSLLAAARPPRAPAGKEHP